MPAIVITNVTAIPIPSAVSTFLDTPKNGHIPKNLDKTKLLTRMALTIMTNKLASPIIPS